MRIAVVSSPVTALRPAQLGGAQAFICDLARGLTERGHDVTLHCAEGSQVDGVKLVTVAAPPDAADALVMPGGSQPPPAPGVAAALGQIFQTIRAMDVDVISQHAFDAPALELPRGLRVLHTLHLPPIVPGVVEAARQVPTGALATVSRSCQAHWRGAGVDVERVLPNGVADIAIESAPSRSALIAGRISPEKGIEHAIAAARSAGIAVRLAGAHYDPAYVVDLHGVETLGSLARDELRRVMATSGVTVCAVRWEEPFGMVAERLFPAHRTHRDARSGHHAAKLVARERAQRFDAVKIDHIGWIVVRTREAHSDAGGPRSGDRVLDSLFRRDAPGDEG